MRTHRVWASIVAVLALIATNWGDGPGNGLVSVLAPPADVAS